MEQIILHRLQHLLSICWTDDVEVTDNEGQETRKAHCIDKSVYLVHHKDLVLDDVHKIETDERAPLAAAADMKETSSCHMARLEEGREKKLMTEYLLASGGTSFRDSKRERRPIAANLLCGTC